MKYIRTKDGQIFETTGEFETHYVFITKMGVLNHTTLSNISKQDIIAQADTIEELCDKCVVKLKYEEQPFVGSFYEFEHFINQYVKKIPSNNPVIDIFGAIWIDKGLIYVAKMNDKGELELL